MKRVLRLFLLLAQAVTGVVALAVAFGHDDTVTLPRPRPAAPLSPPNVPPLPPLATRGGSQPPPRRNRWWRRGVILAVLVAVAVSAGVAAWAYWLASVAKGAGGQATAATMQQGSLPTVAVIGAGAVEISWSGVKLSNGVDAGGYIVSRHDAQTNALETTGIGCNATITDLSCTELGVPFGSWKYTVTPVIGAHWRGLASAQSGAVTISPTKLTLNGSPFGAAAFTGNPALATAAGSISGFAPNEGVHYRLDTAGPLSGSPSAVDGNGDAAGVSVEIPMSAGDGAHTVYALGESKYPSQATAPIAIDTTAPALAAQVSPTPNAAGWNNTDVTVTLTADDGSGTGVKEIVYTDDGTNPKTSGTAQIYGGPFPLSESRAVAFYATDATNNASDVTTILVNVDKVAPTNSLSLDVSQGNAVLDGSTLWYRGEQAGSFSIANAVADDSSGPASSRTSVFSGSALGWTHNPSIVGNPAGGPYTSAPFTWMAGTTDGPAVTVRGGDVADNLTPTTLHLVNDSAPPSGGLAQIEELGGSDGLYSTSKDVQLTLLSGEDSGVGLASSSLTLWRQEAPLASPDGNANGECGGYSGWTQIATTPAGPYTDTVPGDRMCYRYEYRVADRLGNETTYQSGEVKVETSAPASLTPSLSLSNPTGNTFINGLTVYTNPQSGRSGGFRLSAGSPSDDYSGIDRLQFPDLGFDPGTSFSGGYGPYEYDYSWTGANATTSGPQTVTAFDNAGLTADAQFTVTPDTAAPTGGALSVNGAAANGTGTSSWSSTGNFTISRTDYTDGGSGLASSVLEVQTAPLSSGNGIAAGSCGVYGTAAVISGSPAQTRTGPACYRYRLTGTDNVGNTDVIATVVKVDTTAPMIPALTVSGATGNTFVSGSTVYTNPQAGKAGGFTVTATSTDADSGIPQIAFPALSGYTSGGGTISGTPFQTTYAWTGAAATANGAQPVTASNGSGLTSTANFTVTPDTNAPTGGGVTVNGTAATGAGSSSYATSTSFVLSGLVQYTDAGSGIASSSLVRDQAPLAANVCGATWTNATTISGNRTENAGTGIASGTCYRYTLSGSDRVGNTANVQTIVEVDATAPTGPTLSMSNPTGNTYINGSTVYTNPNTGFAGSFTVSAATADPETGIAQVVFPALGTGYTAGGGTLTSPPYTTTYQWGSGANSTGGNVSVKNGAGATSTGSFTVAPDSAAPTGGTLTVNGQVATLSNSTGPVRSTGTFTISAWTDYADAGSGLASSTLTVASAPMSSPDSIIAPVCGTFGTPAPITRAALPITQTVTGPACYQYVLSGVDHVGNAVSISTTVRVDTTPPVAPALAVTGFTGIYTYGSGSAVSINPVSGQSGSFTIAGVPGDPDSGILNVSFPAVTGLTGGPLAVTASPWAITYNWTGSVTSFGSPVTVTSTNGAGSTSTSSFTITKDTSGPTVSGLVLANGGTSGTADAGDTVTITYNEPVKDSTFCSAWTGYTAHTLTGVTLRFNDVWYGTDYLTVYSAPGCTFHLVNSSGIDTRANYVGKHFGQSSDYANSTIAWDPTTRTLKLTLGTPNDVSNLNTNVGNSTPRLTPDGALTDYVNNAISTSLVSGTSSHF